MTKFQLSNLTGLVQSLRQGFLPEQLVTDPKLCRALAVDASCYQLTPKLVVTANSEADIIFIIKQCLAHHLPYTFRAAGTSLSGQAQSDSVLIRLSDDWNFHQVLDDGHKIRLGPKVIGAQANRYLQAFKRKIGPDPASIDTCQIGGIVANNASGMCCGITHNSYQTLDSMRVIFYDGSLLDTGNSKSIAEFKATHFEWLDSLLDLARQVKASPALSRQIKQKYRIKNTTGYGLNALLDFEDPIDMLQHLMIGSEGTLGFIAETTLKTVVINEFKATGLVLLDSLQTACDLVVQLKPQAPAAVELLDHKSLAAIDETLRTLVEPRQLDSASCALLIELEGHELDGQSEDSLAEKITRATQTLAANSRMAVAFSRDSQKQNQLWQLRKSLFPKISAGRKKSTSVIIEDVAFPLENLAAATCELQDLLETHGYHQAVIFGHALDGNLHFVFAQDFSSQQAIADYGNFMAALTRLVKNHQGSLKAEHGTGRNMANFVALEWGEPAYAIMQQIKAIFDPNNLLNPDVILTQATDLHLQNLKVTPSLHEQIDDCMACGFCEPVCPSKNLSLTPRQRIALFRELFADLGSDKISPKTTTTPADVSLFDYLAVQTCAKTGLCAERCPIGIDTGELVRDYLALSAHASLRQKAAKLASDHLGLTSKLFKVALSANQIASKWLPTPANQFLQQHLGVSLKDFPPPAQARLKPGLKSELKLVYFPTCASRSMASHPLAKDPRSLQDVTISLLEKAGYQVIMPDLIGDECCGLALHSQGLLDEALSQASRLYEQLGLLTDGFKLPVLMDSSPCVKRMKDSQKLAFKLYEPVEFASQFLLDRLNIVPLDQTIMLHVTCSSQRMGLGETMLNLAKACATQVIVPDDINCCGFAGDKGFTLPELNASALKTLKAQVPSDCKQGFSNSPTCELGLSRHSGIGYQSILYLLDQVAKPTKI